MNVERLHAVAKAVTEDLQQGEIVSFMQQLQNFLTQQVSNPADAGAQQQVSAFLTRLRSALAQSDVNNFPPTWEQVLDDLDLAPLLGNRLLSRIDEIFERNQITPSVAQEEISRLASEVEAANQALRNVISGLQSLGIGDEKLAPGEAEMAVLIPRDAINSQLARLGSEYVEFQKILGPFLELGTGSRPPVEVRTTSSSDFGLFLVLIPAAAKYLVDGLQSVLNLYKTLLDIREQRQRLAETGIPESNLNGIDEYANSVMASGIEQAADVMVNGANVLDAGRANELKVEIRLSLNAIANRVDRGYNIDVYAEPPPATEPEDDEGEEEPTELAQLRADIEKINSVAERLRFFVSSSNPILSLPEGSPAEETPVITEEP